MQQNSIANQNDNENERSNILMSGNNHIDTDNSLIDQNMTNISMFFNIIHKERAIMNRGNIENIKIME